MTAHFIVLSRARNEFRGDTDIRRGKRVPLALERGYAVLAHISGSRRVWLFCGVLIGIGVAYYWPHEPIRADQSDRTDKFAMISVSASPAIAGGIAGSEGIFILDFLTGRLQGFYLNPNAPAAGFAQMFFRDVAHDLGLDEKTAAQPVYAIVGGQGQLVGQATTFGAGLVYVAEMTTGQLVAYGFPFTVAVNQILPPQPMVPVARAEFRKPVAQ
jgi:hypothetical protein